ncbi:MAG: hypothetical protein RLZZ15_4560 [Verrucomicrobiota bacterium]
MGQSKKLRACPAAGRDISPAECGEHRHGRYACPADCAFNPFAPANYSALLEAENALDLVTFKRLASDAPVALDRLRAADASGSPHAMHATVVWELFFARDAAGTTVAERWERAGLAGLKNDQRVFLRGKMRMRLALLEVRCVRDDQRIDVVDLFDPAGTAMRFVDRSMAARVGRFDVLLGWIYPLPHFWRSSGTAIEVPDLGSIRPVEAVRACVAHLGGPADPAAQPRWLAENFVRMDRAIAATVRERQRLMFTRMDAQWGTATYTLAAPFTKCRAALDAESDVANDALSEKERGEGFTEARVWFASSNEKAEFQSDLPPTGRRVLGRVMLARDRMRVEGMGAARLADLRRRFEARLGEKAVFSTERRDDIGGQLASRQPAAEVALVPPSLLEGPERFDFSTSVVPLPEPGVSIEDHQAELMQQHRRDFADLPVPALGGQTPRAAAADARLRPQLVELIKSHVRRHDVDNLRSGRADDINWLIRELGLAELDFPAPPRRAPPGDEAGNPDDFAAGDDDDADEVVPLPANFRRPDPGPLPARPLTMAKSVERLQAAVDSFELASQALQVIEAESPGLIDGLAEVAEPRMSEDEFSFCVPFVLQVWFALVPAGARPALRFNAIAAAVASEEARLREVAAFSKDRAQGWLAEGPQPGFVEALIGGMMQAVDHTPKTMQPTPAGVIGSTLLLKAFVAEIDRALR